MSSEKSIATDSVSAGLITNPSSTEAVNGGGVFHVECIGADGELKWTDTFHNLVVNEGLQDMNAKYFTGSGYTAAWYLGLVTGPGSGTTYAAGNTLASHAGWTENTAYTGNRKAVTFGVPTTANPSVATNSASPSVFVMNGSATIAGAFLCTVSTGSSGILFSANDFSGGDKTVASGDTLNVTYQFSLTGS
jgi:hypothetical protein